MHYCQQNRIDFATRLNVARQNFEADSQGNE